MRKIWLSIFGANLLALPISTIAQVSVRGYFRSNGTYVQPHVRSAPNNTTEDNWSTRGNVNPYTGKNGSANNYPRLVPSPPTYIPIIPSSPPALPATPAPINTLQKLEATAVNAAPVKQTPADFFAAKKAKALQGDADAQYMLGFMYDIGIIWAEQDYAAASSWYRKAAEQGHAAAQNSLGEMYDKGQGVAQDYGVAVSWYRTAADKGYDVAQYNLGSMYYQGKGVAQDYVQAHKWFNLAGAGAKDAKARDNAARSRDIVAAKMQAAQIAEAQRLASEWRQK